MKSRKLYFNTITLLITFSLILSAFAPALTAEAVVRPIVFPIIGSASYSNDFDAPRANGPHHATDIFAAKRQKIVSPVNGTVTYVPYPQPSYGWALFIEDDQGYEYTFIHLNNDTPGTDDGRGTAMQAYSADMKSGNRVVKGQHIGYVGDSGNAENTPSHLHFEMHAPNGSVINPYDSLRQAQKLSKPNSYPAMPNEVLPYTAGFRGGAHIAMGNFDVDTQSEYVTGAGPGGGPHVKVYESNNTNTHGFFAYDKAFGGGVDVALGDVDGDDVDEIITGAGKSGGPHVKVFERDGTYVYDYFAQSAGFKGGIKVAAGDVDGDGVDEIITGVASGGVPHVKARKLNGTSVASFYAYAENFTGGVDVAAGDIDNDGTDEIITGTGVGGAPQVKVFSANGAVQRSIMAYDSAFRGGVRVSSANIRVSNAQDEILTSPASSGGPHLKLFSGAGTLLGQEYFIESWWRGATYDIAAGYDTSKASAGANRRTTIRLGIE